MNTLSVTELNRLLEVNTVALLRAFAQQPNAHIHTAQGYTAISNPVYSPFFNGVLNIRLNEANVDAAIEEAVAFFKSHANESAFWWLFDDSTPADLEARLAAHGLSAWDNSPAMWLDLTTMDTTIKAPPDFRVEIVRDLPALEIFNKMLAEIFQMPPRNGDAWRDTTRAIGLDRLPYTLYIGYLGDEPVATNMIIDSGDVAGVYAVGVLPRARGLGLGRVITQVPFLEARQRGIKIGMLTASDDGFPVYQKMGFHTFSTVRRYRWDAPTR